MFSGRCLWWGYGGRGRARTDGRDRAMEIWTSNWLQSTGYIESHAVWAVEL